jgi:hypothetical protein
MFHSNDYLTILTICNLLHSSKIDFKTSKIARVQILLNVCKQVLQVNLEVAAKHIYISSEYTYKHRNTYTLYYVNTKIAGLKRIFKLFSLYTVRLLTTFIRLHTARGLYILEIT